MKFYCLVFTTLQIWSHFVTRCHPVIRVFGDVRDPENNEFFKVVLPYLMDSFGGFLSVEYGILGNGIYAVEHMCALKQLSQNNFLAAYYLKCEAEERDPAACLCESGIDEAAYRSCVRKDGAKLSKDVYKRYGKAYGFNVYPVVNYGPVHSPTWDIKGNQQIQIYFYKFCSLFVRAQRPYICLVPLGNCPKRRGLASFQYDNSNSTTVEDNKKCSLIQVEPYPASW